MFCGLTMLTQAAKKTPCALNVAILGAGKGCWRGDCSDRLPTWMNCHLLLFQTTRPDLWPVKLLTSFPVLQYNWDLGYKKQTHWSGKITGKSKQKQRESSEKERKPTNPNPKPHIKTNKPPPPKAKPNPSEFCNVHKPSLNCWPGIGELWTVFGVESLVLQVSRGQNSLHFNGLPKWENDPPTFA